MKAIIAVCLLSVALLGYAVKKDIVYLGDDFIWLEEVLGKRSLEWVKVNNKKSEDRLTHSDHFEDLQSQFEKIYKSKDKIPSAMLLGDVAYNLWQGANHVRGIWRRTLLEDLLDGDPQWETVLDLDKLEESWQKNIVWKGAECLAPDFERCMVALSDGGKDAVTYYEFDLVTLEFLEDGFAVPEAKSYLRWESDDRLFVATDFGPGSLTNSGYPRIIKRWHRGTPLSQAKTVFEGQVSDVSVYPLESDMGLTLVHRAPSFFESEIIMVTADAAETIRLPSSIRYRGLFGSELIFSLREPYGEFGEGDLLALDLGKYDGDIGPKDLRVIFKQEGGRYLDEVAILENHIVLSVMENVELNLWPYRLHKGRFQRIKLSGLPSGGSLSFLGHSRSSSGLLVGHQDYLRPERLLGIQLYESGGKVKVSQRLSATFDSGPFEKHQFFAKSKDGTRIPYTVVAKKGIPLDGKNPTLLYGYGGFEISLLPRYLKAEGPTWLERGGVYVVANIRGGAEFGPQWHRQALKKNRWRAYEDFASVAGDLVERGITSPEYLGIKGGSNGGLLMGVMLTQYPELFSAVVCKVPLLDMLRFHKLLAGASWMGEYGNPEVAAERSYIETYSPYQNLSRFGTYPEPFFLTSTRDDRVHPGHARKMAARMAVYDQAYLYYENIDGGHGGSANLDQLSYISALEYTYLIEKLGTRR